MAPSDLAIQFARTWINQVFPTLIWLADLAPDLFTPLNEGILAKLDAMTGPRVQSYPGETFQTEHNLYRLTEFEPLARAIAKVADGALRQLEIDAGEMVFTGIGRTSIRPAPAIRSTRTPTTSSPASTTSSALPRPTSPASMIRAPRPMS
jgi:hypothetical protein